MGLGARLTARQRRAVSALERLVEDCTTFFKLDAELMGRSAVKTEDQHRTLAALSRAMSGFEGNTGYFAGGPVSVPLESEKGRLDFGKVRGKLKAQDHCSAKPVQASRLKFPPPPSFCPRGYLDRQTQRLFDRPLDFEAEQDPPKAVPSVKVRANRTERIALFKALAESGRLRPVRVQASRIPYAGGMFAVPKDLQRDRLVLDARRGNSLSEPPAYWSATMSSASVLLPIILEAHEELRISSADLRDYFYLFQITEQRLTKNLLEGSLTAQECIAVFGHSCTEFAEPSGLVFPSLTARGSPTRASAPGAWTKRTKRTPVSDYWPIRPRGAGMLLRARSGE